MVTLLAKNIMFGIVKLVLLSINCWVEETIGAKAQHNAR